MLKPEMGWHSTVKLVWTSVAIFHQIWWKCIQIVSQFINSKTDVIGDLCHSVLCQMFCFFVQCSVLYVFIYWQAGSRQSVWLEEMADWGSCIQNWTALLPLLVSQLCLDLAHPQVLCLTVCLPLLLQSDWSKITRLLNVQPVWEAGVVGFHMQSKDLA